MVLLRVESSVQTCVEHSTDSEGNTTYRRVQIMDPTTHVKRRLINVGARRKPNAKIVMSSMGIPTCPPVTSSASHIVSKVGSHWAVLLLTETTPI